MLGKFHTHSWLRSKTKKTCSTGGNETTPQRMDKIWEKTPRVSRDQFGPIPFSLNKSDASGENNWHHWRESPIYLSKSGRKEALKTPKVRKEDNSQKWTSCISNMFLLLTEDTQRWNWLNNNFSFSHLFFAHHFCLSLFLSIIFSQHSMDNWMNITWIISINSSNISINQSNITQLIYKLVLSVSNIFMWILFSFISKCEHWNRWNEWNRDLWVIEWPMMIEMTK